jgi:bacterioferritin-associated ferredoxin
MKLFLIYNWLSRRRQAPRGSFRMYVCICAAVSDRQIKQAVREGARSVDQLAACLGVGTVCGCCREIAQDIVLEASAPLRHEREVARLATPA